MIDHAPYNAIAGIYDDIHRTPDAEAEDRETFAALDYRCLLYTSPSPRDS